MKLAFLILTEDSSPQGVPTLVALLKSMFCLLIPQLMVSVEKAERFRFDPPETELRPALTANGWRDRKTPNGQFARRELVRSIATQLRRENGFVVFHFDGDTPYSNRAASTTPPAFEELIRGPVSELLRRTPRDRQSQLAPAPEQSVLKLLTITPHYCIESWTYYNDRIVDTVAEPSDKPQLEAWRAELGSVEECEKPWAKISLNKHHNQLLSETNFPATVPFEVGKSFADTVSALLHNDALMSALMDIDRLHRPSWWP